MRIELLKLPRVKYLKKSMVFFNENTNFNNMFVCSICKQNKSLQEKVNGLFG